MSGGRRIFVGDIHGCCDELLRLLETVAFDPTRDELYPVGDLVNRGPDSLGALRLVRALGGRPVLGNHDLHLLRMHAGLRKPGRRDTLDTLLRADDAADLCAWVAAQPFVRVFPDLYLVHAGLHPSWRDPAAAVGGSDPLAPGNAAHFAVHVRYCDAAGRLPHPGAAPPGPPFRPWFDFYDADRHEGRVVVFGHWAARGLVRGPHLRGLDTGCVWGGRLTAWIAEGDRLVDVPAARAYASTTD